MYFLSLYGSKDQVTDPDILITHKLKGRKHYVIIDKVETEVFTANQRTDNRLFHNGSQISDKTILNSHKNKAGKHYVTIDGVETQVFTAAQRTKSRLFHNDALIEDLAILMSYEHKNRKHFVTIDGVETQVFTANKRNTSRFFNKNNNNNNYIASDVERTNSLINPINDNSPVEDTNNASLPIKRRHGQFFNSSLAQQNNLKSPASCNEKNPNEPYCQGYFDVEDADLTPQANF